MKPGQVVSCIQILHFAFFLLASPTDFFLGFEPNGFIIENGYCMSMPKLSFPKGLALKPIGFSKESIY